MSEPLLSVCLITYNHAKYIREAIDGVLMQKVNFSWELIIADDFSTDGTREILLKYKEKYPDFIKLILQDKNTGGVKNWMDLMAAPSSEYIAYFEGDDYWTDPSKLQKQVDLLMSHPEFVMCFTNSIVVNEDGSIIRENRLEEERQRNLSQLDIVSGLLPPSNTVLLRNNKILKPMPKEVKKAKNGDMFIFSVLTEYGDAAFINENMAAYRIHSGGTWSTASKEYSYTGYLATRKALLKYFGRKYSGTILPSINSTYIQLLQYYKETKKFGMLVYCCLSFVLFKIRYHTYL